MSLPTNSIGFHCPNTTCSQVAQKLRTYPLPMTNTLSHCCQLQSSQPKAFHPVASSSPVARSSPARKQKKTLGGGPTFPLPVTNTAANSKAVDPEPLILLPVLPGTKQTDGGGLSGGPTKNQTLKLSALLLLASGKQSLTLLLFCTIIAAFCFFLSLNPSVAILLQVLRYAQPQHIGQGATFKQSPRSFSQGVLVPTRFC